MFLLIAARASLGRMTRYRLYFLLGRLVVKQASSQCGAGGGCRVLGKDGEAVSEVWRKTMLVVTRSEWVVGG